MPEGDTVWRAARRLDRALRAKQLTRSDFRVPAFATRDLTGNNVVNVVSRGKHLLTRIEGGTTLHTHLRMDGSWRTYVAGERWNGGPGWQIRAVLSVDGFDAVGYRLPIVELVPTAKESQVVGHLGPDLLDPSFDREEAVRRLRAQPDREIGPALLDQRNVAGIGNLYKAETLFLCHVSPWARVESVTDLGAVLDTARRLLLSNLEGTEQSTTGDLRRGKRHFVFERSHQPCRRCGNAVRTARQDDPLGVRITYWCGICQRLGSGV